MVTISNVIEKFVEKFLVGALVYNGAAVRYEHLAPDAGAVVLGEESANAVIYGVKLHDRLIPCNRT